MILETGETKWLGLGVVFDDYGTNALPGWFQGTVGYHTDDRRIFDADYIPGTPFAKHTALTGKIGFSFVCFFFIYLFIYSFVVFFFSCTDWEIAFGSANVFYKYSH